MNTPETNSATMQLHGKRLATGGWYVEAEFARRLEQQRDIAVAALQMYYDRLAMTAETFSAAYYPNDKQADLDQRVIHALSQIEALARG